MAHDAEVQDTAPVEVAPRRFRRRSHESRFFRVALLVSLVLHLSTFTLFRIVIYFPRQDIDYYQFRIVEAREDRPAPRPQAEAPAGGSELTLSGLERSLETQAGDITELSVGLPPIQLPTLEFAELRRFRVRQETLASRKLYDEIFREEEGDSWSRFSEGIASLRGSLRRLTLDDTSPLGESLESAFPTSKPPETFRPASGFEAELQWEVGSSGRRLLFSPPMEALWDLAGGHLAQPVELVLQVNPEGRVVNAWSPSLEQAELVEELQFTALRYRFEPKSDGPAVETATLLIREAAEAGL